MKIIDVDDVSTEPLQARVTALCDVIGRAVRGFLSVGQIDIAELGRNQRLVAPAVQCTAKKHFVPRAPIASELSKK